jgi:asparagine synthase (glutamine-hydrolysing)
MSGIAGIYNIDGAPVDRVLLKRMTDAIAHRGPDGIHLWVDGSVGMGHCMLQTTPESIYERQPLTDESGVLCLTMDGRVDNREELISALESRGGRLRNDTDAEIVLKAYECWGTECPARIIGDFSFVIWDRGQRQLFCARDILGVKPFYYYTDGRKFLWASELHQLFRDSTVPREPNEGMVAEYLAASLTDREETLYKGILRLPPAPASSSGGRTGSGGTGTSIHIKKFAIKRWKSTPSISRLYSRRCGRLLRSHKPVGAELSGAP